MKKTLGTQIHEYMEKMTPEQLDEMYENEMGARDPKTVAFKKMLEALKIILAARDNGKLLINGPESGIIGAVEKAIAEAEAAQ